MAYTSFDKDIATPKEKGNLTFPDPSLNFGLALVNEKLQAAIDKCHLRKESGNVWLAKDAHAFSWRQIMYHQHANFPASLIQSAGLCHNHSGH